MEGAWSFEDLLVLLIVVAFGMRFVNGGDDVVGSAVAILTSSGPFRLITATVLMVAAVVVVAVTVASFVGAVIAAVSWAMSACILVKAYFGLLGIGVLIGGCNHLANPLRLIAIKLGAEVAVMESSDKGGDDL